MKQVRNVNMEGETFTRMMTSGSVEPRDSVLLELNSIHKSFGTKEVLHGVDLVVKKGEHVVIFGPSGSGKSTMLRSINLLEEPDSGSIKVLGTEYGPGVQGRRE